MKLHHKTPLSFVLVLLVNIVLIVAFEILFLFRFPPKPTEEMLAKVDSRYENCQIYGSTNVTSDRGVHFFLVKAQDGQTDLVPMQQHSFFPSRTWLRSGKIIQNLDLTQESSEQLLMGTTLFRILVTDGQIHTMATVGGSFQQAALTKYLGLGAVLAFFEMLLWEKLKGN